MITGILHCYVQVKAAFTRSYNKSVHLTPYSTGAAVKKRGRQEAGADEDVEDAYNEVEQADVEKRDDGDSDDDISTDRMIVVLVLCLFASNIKWHYLTNYLSARNCWSLRTS